MTDNTKTVCGVFFFLFALTFLFGIIGLINEKHEIRQEQLNKIEINLSYEKGYVQACKDFYKGKMKYDLVENEDGTKEWKLINK